MVGCAVHHCQTDFFRRNGNQFNRIFVFRLANQVVGQIDTDLAAAFVEADHSAFVQAVEFAFIQSNGLELAGFAHAVENGNDFGLNRTGRGVRHHIEAVEAFGQFQQIVVFADFGNGFFDNQRLRGLGAQLHDFVDLGVILVAFEFFVRSAGTVFQGGVGVRQRVGDAAEHDFLAEEFAGFRIGDVFIDAVGQVAAGFGQAVCVHAVTLGVEDAVVGACNQARRVGGFFWSDNLRMFHEHAIEIDVDGRNTVAGSFAYARMQFDHGNAV